MEEQITKSCHLGLFSDLSPTRLSTNGNVGFDFSKFSKTHQLSFSLSQGSEFFPKRGRSSLSLSLCRRRVKNWLSANGKVLNFFQNAAAVSLSVAETFKCKWQGFEFFENAPALLLSLYIYITYITYIISLISNLPKKNWFNPLEH